MNGSTQAGRRHWLADILRPSRPLPSPETMSDNATSCCAAEQKESSRPVRRSTRCAQSEVENDARGARLERRRRHQKCSKSASRERFPQLGGWPSAANRGGPSHFVVPPDRGHLYGSSFLPQRGRKKSQISKMLIFVAQRKGCAHPAREERMRLRSCRAHTCVAMRMHGQHG